MLCQSTRLILGYTSFCNIGFLTLIAIYEPCNIYHQESFKYTLSKPVIFYLLNSFELLRNWLYVLLSFERLFYIVRPLEFKNFWRNKVVILTLSLFSVLAFLLRIPSFLITCFRPKMPEDIAEYCRHVHILTDCILLCLIPECLMVGLSITTSLLVRKRNIDRQRLGKNKTGLGLVNTFLVAFFFLTFPSMLTTMAIFFFDYTDILPSKHFALVLSILILLSNLCSIVNSLVGFFIYMGYTARYRDALIRFLRLQKLIDAMRLLLQMNS